MYKVQFVASSTFYNGATCFPLVSALLLLEIVAHPYKILVYIFLTQKLYNYILSQSNKTEQIAKICLRG